MRPVHVILAMLPPLMYPNKQPVRVEGATRLCTAIEWLARDELIDSDEATEAAKAIMEPIVKHGTSFLITVARDSGAIPEECHSRSSAYIVYRNQWLQDLIESTKNEEQS